MSQVHVKCQRTNPGDRTPESIEVLHISISGNAKVLEFTQLLSRAANINYPNVHQDWRDLLDIITFGEVMNASPAPRKMYTEEAFDTLPDDYECPH